MLIDKDLMERYKAVLQAKMINQDSYKFNAVALDVAKLNMTHLFSRFFEIQMSMLFPLIFKQKK